MPWALCKETSQTARRALAALIRCLVWLKLCGAVGLIVLPDLACPFGQTTDSIDRFMELGQTFD